MAQQLNVLLNSESGLWYDGRYGESARHFWIELESYDSNLNQISKLRNLSLTWCYVWCAVGRHE